MTAARPTILAETLTWSFRLLFALVAALAGMWLVRGIQRVPPENRAVVMRFGQVVRTAGPGLLLTWPSPIDSVVLLPSLLYLFRIFGPRGQAAEGDGQEQS